MDRSQQFTLADVPESLRHRYYDCVLVRHTIDAGMMGGLSLVQTLAVLAEFTVGLLEEVQKRQLTMLLNCDRIDAKLAERGGVK